MDKSMHSMDRLTSKPTPLAGFVLFVVGLAFILYVASPNEEVRSLELGEERANERRAARAEVDSVGTTELSSYGIIDAETGRYRLSIDRTMGLMVRDWRNDSQQGREAFLKRVEQVYPVAQPEVESSTSGPSLDQFE